MASSKPGFTQRVVTVDEVILSRGVARCLMAEGNLPQDVSLSPRRAGMPEAGEIWIIDREYGYWSFAAMLRSPKMFFDRIPVVEQLPTPTESWAGVQLIVTDGISSGNDGLYTCLRRSGHWVWLQSS